MGPAPRRPGDLPRKSGVERDLNDSKEDREFKEAVARFVAAPDSVRSQILRQLLMERTATGRRGARRKAPAERMYAEIAANMFIKVGHLVRLWNRRLPRHLRKEAEIDAYMERKGFPGPGQSDVLQTGPWVKVEGQNRAVAGQIRFKPEFWPRLRRATAHELADHRTLKRQIGRGGSLRLRIAVICVQFTERVPPGIARDVLESRAGQFLERLKKPPSAPSS